MKKPIYLLLVLLTGLAAGSALAGNGPGPGSGPGPGTGNPDPGALTSLEADTLQYMREEEKLARDTYAVLYNTWNAGVFLIISRQEQRHMDAMLKMLNLYQVSDPAEGNGPGVFKDPGLQSLYDELIELGSVSLRDAYQVGVIIEETDITDLQAAISGTAEQPLINAYSNLLAGSYNHLAAFVHSINALGEDYVSEFLDPEGFGPEWGSAVMDGWVYGCGQPQPPGPKGPKR